MSAMNNGQSLIENNERSRSAKLMRELATKVSGRASVKQQQKSPFADLASFLSIQDLRDKLRDTNLPFKLFKSNK
jgi:Flp pilus assembly CpaE family ATPase